MSYTNLIADSFNENIIVFFSHDKISRGNQLQALGQCFTDVRAEFSVIFLAFPLLYQDGSSYYIHNPDRKKRESGRPELGHRESWERSFLALQTIQ